MKQYILNKLNNTFFSTGSTAFFPLYATEPISQSGSSQPWEFSIFMSALIKLFKRKWFKQ